MTQPNPMSQTTESLHNSSNPEALDEVVSTTTPRLWWALIALIALIAVGVVWAFVGRIPLSVTSTGVVEIAGGRQVLPSPIDGAVTLSIFDQDTVTQGQQLATVTPFDTTQSTVAITAPFAGALTSVNVRSGAGVAAGQTIAVVSPSASTSPSRVIAFVGPADVSRFTPGNKVDVRIGPAADPGATVLGGTIASVSAIPVSAVDIEADGLPIVAAQIIEQAATGLAYPTTITLNVEAGAINIQDGQIVTVVNTYDNVRPIDAIVGGSR